MVTSFYSYVVSNRFRHPVLTKAAMALCSVLPIGRRASRQQPSAYEWLFRSCVSCLSGDITVIPQKIPQKSHKNPKKSHKWPPKQNSATWSIPRKFLGVAKGLIINMDFSRFPLEWTDSKKAHKKYHPKATVRLPNISGGGCTYPLVNVYITNWKDPPC